MARETENRVIMWPGMQVEGRSGMPGKAGTSLQAVLGLSRKVQVGSRGYYSLIELGSLGRNKHQ